MTLRTMFLAATAVVFAGAAGAQTKYPAVLEAQTILPAQTVIPAPADAPAELQISGRFATPSPKRVDEPESVTGISALSDKSAPRTTGIKYPFKGQPIQGLSGIKNLQDGTFLTLTDNGFGSRANSPDAMLMFHVIRPDWKSGKLERLSTTFLSDPDRKVPFRIVNENTPTRYLTGADFDIESIQPIGDTLWFGDELGPFLVKTDRSGKVLQVFDTTLDGKTLRSPDNPYLAPPPAPGPMKFEVKRSKGFEGMAQSPDGKHLYGLLEGPLWLEASNTFENKDGKPYLRILEFDVEKGAFTGKSWKYPLELPGNAIGDFNLIDATSGLIIERDDGEGDEAQACQGAPQPDCFNVPAKFKRIYKVDFTQADADGFVKKVGYIDLLDIQDPNKVARQGGKDGKFTFPFFTIENVDVVDADHIIVGNDNNLPFSSGRAIGRSDDNEMVLLRVPELLRAK